jgi:uncharacterized protein (DUF1800 family)
MMMKNMQEAPVVENTVSMATENSLKVALASGSIKMTTNQGTAAPTKSVAPTRTAIGTRANTLPAPAPAPVKPVLSSTARTVTLPRIGTGDLRQEVLAIRNTVNVRNAATLSARAGVAVHRFAYALHHSEIPAVNANPTAWLENQLSLQNLDFAHDVPQTQDYLRQMISLAWAYGGFSNARAQYMRRIFQTDAMRLMQQAVLTTKPFLFQWSLFWFNHLSAQMPESTAQDQQVLPFLHPYFAHTIVANSLGKFEDMLIASGKSPSMMARLNGSNNFESAPNQDYARELLEMHTIGALDASGNPNYTQDDVIALSKVFAGNRVYYHSDNVIWRIWGAEIRPGDYYIDMRYPHKPQITIPLLNMNLPRADYMPEVIARAESVWRALARSEKTARNIAEKLVNWFFTTSRAQANVRALVTKLSQNYMATGGDLRHLALTMIRDPLATTAMTANMANVKMPMQYMLGVYRAGDVLGEMERVRMSPLFNGNIAPGTRWDTPAPNAWIQGYDEFNQRFSNLTMQYPNLWNLIDKILPSMNMPHFAAPTIQGYRPGGASVWMTSANMDALCKRAVEIAPKINASRTQIYAAISGVVAARAGSTEQMILSPADSMGNNMSANLLWTMSPAMTLVG